MDEIMELTVGEYKELIEKAERIAAVERLLKKASFLTVAEMASVLGIEYDPKELVAVEDTVFRFEKNDEEDA